MDRRRGATQPAGQDGPGTLKPGDKFKIPKKKKVTEMDNVETQSPLSRLTDSRIENLKPSHKRWPFSYNTFNKTRNRDSIAYSQRRKCGSKHNFQGDDVQLKEARIVLRDVLMTDSGRQHLLHLKKQDYSNVESTDTSNAKKNYTSTSELKDNCHVETKTSHQDSHTNILSSRWVLELCFNQLLHARMHQFCFFLCEVCKDITLCTIEFPVDYSLFNLKVSLY
ncbi:uncharacterized protein LOC109928028 isoform X2 [Rhincodon typus]|nr:uncharacterized protein LOC109928028 isoform X2 [Rhincodon typus]XP_048458948.1 uncharacterized protein LOC109928028 isoform X2 [Rhincodon typus]XP_048458949.1 uncharacterized protein LOC109928028 isoform X2 [Rhincodon typus]